MADRIRKDAGFAELSELPKGPNGRILCRFCKHECGPPRRTFCSEPCVHEWKVRTQLDYAKRFVARRDNGACQLCGTDTFAPYRPFNLLRFGHPPQDGFPPRRVLGAFDMDHIVPVCEGGGACGLDNLRTLCRPCHRAETAKLAARRAAARKQKSEVGNV